MRKAKIILAIALALAALTGVALNQVNGVSAQGDAPVGVVVAYVPGVSITIVDQKGNQIEYALDAAVKIESSDGDKTIKVGSIVTIIAPASMNKGKQVAVGIVVHPEKELLPSETPRVKDTAVPTDVPVTKTPKVNETPTTVETATEVASVTPTGTLTDTANPTTNTKENSPDLKANAFIEWLRSLFRQVLSQ